MRALVKITRTARFKKAWKELTEEEKELGRKALRNLAADLRYPALRVKKMQGVEHIWEARVSRSLRMTFEIQRDTIILRNIGRHDETLQRP
jgi:mRNA-degrading endonuclease YafQ of YafQ-DinJ toxin-antitoxin module